MAAAHQTFPFSPIEPLEPTLTCQNTAQLGSCGLLPKLLESGSVIPSRHAISSWTDQALAAIIKIKEGSMYINLVNKTALPRVT